jgi:hypothetical protein
MYLNETYSKVRMGKHLSDAFAIQNGLKQGDALLPLLFNFDPEFFIRKIQENKKGLELAGTHQLPFYAMLGRNINIITKNTKALLDASKKINSQ